MSQDNKKSMVMYQGDGSNNVFSVPFDKGFYGEISVLFVRRGATTFEYDPKTFTLNEDNTLLTWTGDTLKLGDYICIIRNTETGQPYDYQNNQKHIEQALDNLSRQIQEVADAADRALKLDPTYSIDSDKMNPIEWLQTIVRCKDLTVRGLRFANNVLQYSKDDPEKPESEKTWYSLLNTDGITNVRERYDVGTDTYYFEYSTDGGSNWKDVGEIIRHNGLQGRDEADCHPISAITGLQDKLDEKLNTESAEETYATKTELSSHTENTDNPHNVTKAQVGLGNVDNTSDLSKPISTATQNALNGKLSIKQNPQDAGKIVKVGSDGNLELSSESSGGGLQSVSHGATLKGAGTDLQPLDVADGSIGNTQLAEEVKDEIAGKQPAGDYATNTALQQGLATKQPVGNYATEEELTQGLAGKANKATTLAGYGITDGATKTELNTKLSTVATDGKTITGNGTTADPLTVAKSGAGRNIGDMFWTTRTDSALNGAVEANGAQYNFADVNQGQNNVQALLTSGALPSVTIAEFDTKVASDGGCDSFGYDSGATYFKVPKKLGRVLVRSQKPTADNNYTWYNVYADGWVEQGGIIANLTDEIARIVFPIIMADVNYTILAGQYVDNPNSQYWYVRHDIGVNGFLIKASAGTVTAAYWRVSGYAASSEYAQSTWDYQNVQVERPMVQLFNGATDEAVATCTSVLSDVAGLKQTTDGMIDYVVESQEPTGANGYTWYRLYKSGWVEQGGSVGNPNNGCVLVTLPISMSNTSFTALASGNTSSDAANYNGVTCERRSSTQIGVCTTGQQGKGCSWRVVGYAGGVSLFAYKATDGTVYYVGEIGMSDIDELILYMQDNEPGFLMQKNSSGGLDYVDYSPPIGITTSVLTIMLSTGGEIDCSRSPADDMLYYGQ